MMGLRDGLKIMHKKEKLLEFLKRMWELNKKYKTSTYKFSQIKRRARGVQNA